MVSKQVLTEADRAQQFRILVTTPEKLDLMLRGGWEGEIGRPLTLVVVDEAHGLGVCAVGKITSSTSHQMAQNTAEADGIYHHGAFLWHRYRTISHHEVPKSFWGADS